MLHSWGNPNVSDILTVGTCFEITVLTVVICTVPLCTFHCFYSMDTTKCISLTAEQWEPTGTELSASLSSVDTKTYTQHTCTHTLRVDRVLSHMLSFSHAHAHYAINLFRGCPKSVEITGINYTPLLTHLTPPLESITSLIDWKLPRLIAAPWLTHLYIDWKLKRLSKQEENIVQGLLQLIGQTHWILQDWICDIFAAGKVFLNTRLPATF